MADRRSRRAERGGRSRDCSRRSGPSGSPTRRRDLLRGRQPHVRRGRRQREPARARAARARRAGRRRRRAACARTGPSSSRRVAAAQRAGLAAHDGQLAPHRRRGRLHRRRLRRDRVRRRRALRATPRPARPSSRRGCTRAVAVGGDDRRLRARGTTCSPREDGADIDDPRAGGTMLYTSGTTGRPKGVRRAARSARRRSTSAALTQYDADRHVHLLHRSAVPRRAARVLVVGAGRARRADRDDGRLVGGGDAARSSSSTASRTRTWCRRCSTGCSRCPTT